MTAAEEALGVKFSRIELLALALTHKSFINENPDAGIDSNERLEFLGDGVVDMVTGRRLYDLLPDATEGELTVRRSHVVRKETLARAGRRLDIGKLLVMGRGEEASGGRARTSNLANAVEALIGAVYLDAGMRGVEEFIDRCLGEEIESSARSETLKDPKSALQELLQSRKEKAPSYSLVSAAGDEHDRRFVVEVCLNGKTLGRGEGRRKIDAEREAATVALKYLEEAG